MTAEECAGLLVDALREVSLLRGRIADLAGERDTYRQMSQVALKELGQLTARLERQSETITRLHEILRAQRQTEAA